ncbi:MAG: FumA C-terminus/TtdB family hydratase beta subunit [Coriobacteriia bacterium]|nr:FumA C-terminus/TtdB family hydratase beta subunit [Coriobacteriia bacterium]
MNLSQRPDKTIEIRKCADNSVCTDLRELRVGDECLLSGPIYTVRDATCKRLIEEMEEQGALPYGLEGQMLFFAGPTPARAGQPIGSIGPTTARRMDAATVALMGAGIIATLGKGSRSPEIAEVCKRVDGVYFGAVGGIAALSAQQVRDAQMIAYEELGCEALMRLDLVEFPVFVALDTEGTDWYQEAPKQFLKSI